MEVATYWSGIVVGVLGSLYGVAVVASAWRSGTPQSVSPATKQLPANWFLGTTAALILIGLALTIPAASPFAAGMRLGIGLLIGGAFALAVAYAGPIVSDAPSRDPQRAWIVAVSAHLGLASWALLGANLTLLLFRGHPTDALIGFALGCCVVGLVMRVGADALASSQAGRWRCLEAFVALAVTLSASAYIAVHRFALTEQRVWWALPLLVAAIGIATAIVGTRFAEAVAGRGTGRTTTLSLIVGTVLLAGVTYALSLKAFPPRSTFWVVLCGLGATLAILWLLSAMRATPGQARGAPMASAVQVASACAVLIVLAVVVCFRLLGGYGIGLALAAAWPVALIAIGPGPSKGAPAGRNGAHVSTGLISCLTLGLLVLLVRLFLERNPQAPQLDFSIHYVFVGLNLGALLPFLFAAFGLRTSETAARLVSGDNACAATRSVLIRTLIVGLVCLAAPLLVLFMWGFKATLGLLAGLVAAQALLTVFHAWQSIASPDDAPNASSLALPGLGILSMTVALVAIQFSHLMVPLAAAERVHKIYVVVGVLALGVIWLLVDAWRSRRDRGQSFTV